MENKTKIEPFDEYEFQNWLDERVGFSIRKHADYPNVTK